MPESAIRFGSYEAAKRFMAHLEGHGDARSINSSSKFVAGGLGGMAAQLCVYPLDTLKFRMQCNVEAHGLRGNALIIKTAKQMIAEGGMRSAYRGLTMGLVGMFPYSAIDLGTFELLKAALMKYNAKKLGVPLDDPTAQPGSFANAIMGAFAGSIGASSVYPVNLVRTRLQAQGTIMHPQTYTGMVDCTRKTLQKEGIRGLYKGLAPNLMKVIPSVSITYVVYENAKKMMHLT
jgi:solute carrier family 25 phosphate transporter 23/24/25/41